ncbi:MAG TPA: APC family permease [Vicinamibacteria bacterium]|nr:APC family permease [Vicinamibacteria bacterium]
MTENEGLKREIGVFGLVSNSVNIVVGAGIFVLPAIVAAQLGTASVLAYVLCGILIVLMMLCFAEIGSRITTTGGAYAYIEVAFGRFAGFLTTNLFIFGAAIMANAAVANALADTISYFLPAFKTQAVRLLFFVVMFGGFAYFNIMGVKRGLFLVKFNTVAKMTPLFLLVLFGWLSFSASNFAWEATPSFGDLGQASMILLFAFVGIETGLNVSGEIKDPQRTIPKGVLLSAFVVVLLYTLIQLTAQGVLGEALPSFRDAPLAEVGMRMVGPLGASLVIVGACFSMFGNLSGFALNMPRIIFAAARDGVIPPKRLATIHSRYATPHVAVVSYAALACFFASTGQFEQLSVLASASFLLIYLGVILAVIKYRMRKEDEPGTYKMPGGYLIPGASAVAVLWFLSNLPEREIRAMLVFLVVLSVIYWGLNVRRSKNALTAAKEDLR